MSISGLFDVRKVLKSLRGGDSPGEVALGVCLGLSLGLLPWGIHLFIPILLVLFLQCSTGMVFFMFGLSKGLFLLIAPLFFRTGFLLLGQTALFDGTVRFLRSLPVFGLMALNNYLVFGSLVVLLVLVAAVFPLVYFLVRLYRNRIERWFAELGFVKRYGDTKVFSFFVWLFFGPSDRDEAAEDDKDTTTGNDTTSWYRIPFGMLRGKMIVTVVVLGFLCAFVGVPFLNARLPGIITGGMNTVSGSTSSVSGAWVSPLRQNMVLEDVSLADPENEEQNIFEADRLEMGLSVPALLAGRLRITTMEARGIRFHAERRKDGSLNLDDLEPVEPEGESGQDLKEWLKKNGEKVDWYQLLRRYVQYYRERQAEKTSEQEERTTKEKRTLPDDMRYATKEMKPRRPYFQVDSISLVDCRVSAGDQGDDNAGEFALKSISGSVKNISSSPDLLNKPVRMDLSGTMTGTEESTVSVNGAMEPGEGDSGWTTRINLNADGFSLVKHRHLYESSLPVRVLNGAANFKAELAYNKQNLNAPVELVMRDLVLEKPSKETRFLGLKPETARYVVRGINAYAQQAPVVFGFLVTGTPAEPAFQWKGEVLRIAKEGLVALGKQKYQEQINRINGELESIKNRAEVELSSEYKNIKKSAAKSLKSGDPEEIRKELQDLEKKKEKLDDVKDKLKDINPFGDSEDD